MAEKVLRGRGDSLVEMPRRDWERELEPAPEAISRRLDFMSHEHHLVRNFVVQEIVRRGRPISVSEISDALHLSQQHATDVVKDLERNLFFLVRGDGREVSWAFPVTAESTGHHLVFSTGERLDAA